MKERPILMTPDNAQKCHDGTKTQTRRIVKLPAWSTEVAEDNARSCVPFCPYGQVGDRLWVREAWAWPGEEAFLYKGNPSDARLVDGWRDDQNNCQVKWKPSIHMPRLACRTVLEITEIRVERLQEISEEDAKAEGCKPHPPSGLDGRVYRRPFECLWESINGAGSWALNPWVWVMTFQKVGVLTFQKVP